MNRQHNSVEESTLPPETTGTPAHLTVDPVWDLATVIEFGSVWDGQPSELQLALEEDERLGFLLRESTGPVIGFRVHEPHDLDPETLEAWEVWDGPRFSLPQLGLHGVSIGEILLAVRARYGREEPTNDAFYFHLAISTKEEGGGPTGRHRVLAAGPRGGRHEGALRARVHPLRVGPLP